MDWPVLVLVAIAIALVGIGVWWWLQRRGLADAAPDEAPTAAEPVAIPVGEPESAPVAVAVTPTHATVAGGREAAAARARPAEPATPPAAESPAVAASPAPVASAEPAPERIVRTDDPAHPFGPGSAAPRADGGGPKGWAVKGNADSGLYHTPSSPSWKRMKAEAWFEDEAAAEAAGFTRWDWRRNAS